MWNIMKFFGAIFTVAGCIYLQIVYNVTGYNYFLPAILVVFALYFKEIKKISVGSMSFEKYEQITNNYESSIILFYKTLLDMGLYKSKTPYYIPDVLWENYESMVEIYNGVESLPNYQQKKLKNDYQQSLQKAINLQIDKFYYQGKAEKPTEILPFNQLEIAENQRIQKNFKKAKKAYKNLYKRYRKLLN